jgi:hypothetical protein
MEMEMKHIIIGIDYSLKSPAICILKDGKYKFISFPKKLEKKELKGQEEVQLLKDVDLQFQNDQQVETTYSKNEFAKISHYRQQALTILDLITKNLTQDELNKSTFHIGFEGYSFGSPSNNLIDIIGATTALKTLILEKNIFKTFTLDVYSPKAIKKLAGYGSYDKADLFDVFIGEYRFIAEKYKEQIAKDKKGNFHLDYSDDKLCGDFHKHCSNLEINRNLKKVKIPKPIDDLIDSYFIARCLWESYGKV